MKTVEEQRSEIKNAIDNQQIQGFVEEDSLYMPIENPSNSVWFVAFVTGMILLLGWFEFRHRLNLSVSIRNIGAVLVLISAWPAFGSKNYAVYDFGKGLFYNISKIKSFVTYKSKSIDVREVLEIGTSTTFIPNEQKTFIMPSTTESGEVTTIIQSPQLVTAIYLLVSGGKMVRFTGNHHDSINCKEDHRRVDFLANLLEIPGKNCTKTQMLKVVSQGVKPSFNIIELTEDTMTNLSMKINGQFNPNKLGNYVIFGILVILLGYILYLVIK